MVGVLGFDFASGVDDAVTDFGMAELAGLEAEEHNWTELIHFSRLVMRRLR